MSIYIELQKARIVEAESNPKMLEGPEKQDLVLEQILYALSDANRLRIVRMIDDSGGELPCGAFAEVLNIGKPTLSHHFNILRAAGVIATRVDGTHKFNKLRTKDLNSRFPGLLDAVLKAK